MGLHRARSAAGRSSAPTRSSATCTCRSTRRRPTTTAATGSATTCSRESLVCLDVETGKRVWHYQFVHHGLWDYDPPAAPNLLDITVDGQRIKAVAQVTKQGFVFTFDRVTGQPIWPIEERPVPPSDVPGERASPHAAVSRPGPRRSSTRASREDDLVDFTPEIRAMAEKAVEGLPDRAALHAAVARSRRRQPRDARAPERRAAAPTGPAPRSIRRRACCTCRRGTRSRCSGSSRRGTGPEGQPAIHGGARRCAAADAAGTAALQAAVLAHDGDRHEHRRARVDGAARRRRRVREPSDAEGPEPAAARRRQHDERTAADEDAAHQRAARAAARTTGRGSSRATRRPAAKWRRSICRASRSARR